MALEHFSFLSQRYAVVGAVKINGGPVLQQCNHAVNGGIQVDDGIVIGIDGFFQTGLGVVHIAGCRGKTFRLRGVAERHMAPVIVNDIKLPVAAEVFQGFLHDQGSSFLHHSGRLVLERRLSPFTAVPCQDAQGIIMNGISAQVHDTDGAESVFVEQVNEGGMTGSAAAQFRIRKHADGGNSGHDAEGSGMGEGNDVGLSGKPGHCVPMVTVQGKMVPPDTLPHVENHGQVVWGFALGKGLRAGRKVPQCVETPRILGDVFVRQFARHCNIHERPAFCLVRRVVKIKGFRAVGGCRNAQQQKGRVQAPNACQCAPRGFLAQGTAAPVDGQVDKPGQKQGSCNGSGGAEGAGFLEIGLRHAGKHGKVQDQSVPHLHHVQARIEQNDGGKKDIGGEAVFQAEKNGAAEQGCGAGDAHAAHQQALAIVEHIGIGRQRRRKPGCPQAAHAAGNERGAQSLADSGRQAVCGRIPFCGTGGCMGRDHRKGGIKNTSCLKRRKIIRVLK